MLARYMYMLQVLLLVEMASASLLGVSIDSLQRQTKATLVGVDKDGLMQVLGNIPGGSGILPNNFAVDAAGVTVGGYGADGAVLHRLGFNRSRNATWAYGSDFLPTNMLSDTIADVAILDALNLTTRQHEVFEVDGQGHRTRRYAFDAKVVVDVAVSTYCDKGRVFFLTLRDDDVSSGTDLVRVNLTSGALLGRAPFEEQPQAILWDSSTATLYAWVQRGPPNRTAWGACLITVDVETGESREAVACFDGLVASLASTPMALDTTDRAIYSALIKETKVSAIPHWVSVDLRTGKSTQHVQAGFLIGLAWQHKGLDYAKPAPSRISR
jgi:hypothetical protein